YQLHFGGFTVRHWQRASAKNSGLIRKVVATRTLSRSLERELVELQPSVVAVRSVAYLPLGVKVKQRTGAKLMYDIHELETETAGLTGVKKRLYKFIESNRIRAADGVIVVSDSIADWYRDVYKIERPTVVRAVPDSSQRILNQYPETARELFGLSEDVTLFAYAGLLDANRGIGKLIEIFRNAPPDKKILFMGSGAMADEVKKEAKSSNSIFYLPSVEPEKVISRLQGVDAGLMLTKAGVLSHEFALPNKFFQYLFAGASVICSEAPEMAKLIEKHNCGWTFGNAEGALEELIYGLTKGEIQSKQIAALEAATEFTWEAEEEKLIAAYARLLNG
ncbi:MAG: glycosyltransferase, partial [Fimbriimonadaceae bacterium]